MSESLQLRSITLRVARLERSLDFYASKLGLTVLRRDGAKAELGSGPNSTPLLSLIEDAKAVPPPRDAAGLFHAAMLLPTLGALGSWLRQTADAGIQFDGFSDHRVSEALYLSDPDGNGLEFYADRPRETWPYEAGQLQMATDPLALPDLLAAGARYQDGPPLSGAYWGHLHLRVTDLDRSEAFYCKELGMEPVVRYGTSARFLAADGYHHHLGLNTWGGVRKPHPAGQLGLVEATFARTGISANSNLLDPDEINLRVVSF